MILGKYRDWREYQEKAAAFFRRKGCKAEVEARIKGARAEHKIDIYVSFSQLNIESNWIIECKLWNSRVTKEKVLALKSIVEDIGADKGIIISEEGFQSGACDAARGTNIALVTSLEEFERTAETITQQTKLIECAITKNVAYPIYIFPNGDQPRTLLKYGDRVFVGNWPSGNIAILDSINKTIVRCIELDKYELISSVSKKREILQCPPGDMVIADGKLFVGQVFSDFIIAIDIDTNAIVKRIAIPGGSEGYLASSADGRYIFFASNSVNQLFIIDSSTYEFMAVPYPIGGRGSSSIFSCPQRKLLYIGIQRGGIINSKLFVGSSSFIAVYDLNLKRYVKNINLSEIIDDRYDSSSPISITYDESENQIFVGMFQSRKGIYRIDATTNEIINNIVFSPNEHNKHFAWVDPLSQVLYNNLILSVNRNNCELAVVKKESGELLRTIFLGEAPNGPQDIIVVNNEIIISYPERNGLFFIGLDNLA